MELVFLIWIWIIVFLTRRDSKQEIPLLRMDEIPPTRFFPIFTYSPFHHVSPFIEKLAEIKFSKWLWVTRKRSSSGFLIRNALWPRKIQGWKEVKAE